MRIVLAFRKGKVKKQDSDPYYTSCGLNCYSKSQTGSYQGWNVLKMLLAATPCHNVLISMQRTCGPYSRLPFFCMCIHKHNPVLLHTLEGNQAIVGTPYVTCWHYILIITWCTGVELTQFPPERQTFPPENPETHKDLKRIGGISWKGVKNGSPS